MPLAPVGAQAGGVQPLGLSPGGDSDGVAGGDGGEGPTGEEGVSQVSGLLGVVSPSLLWGQVGGARGRALQVPYTTVSQGGVNMPGVSSPGAAVDSGAELH